MQHSPFMNRTASFSYVRMLSCDFAILLLKICIYLYFLYIYIYTWWLLPRHRPSRLRFHVLLLLLPGKRFPCGFVFFSNDNQRCQGQYQIIPGKLPYTVISNYLVRDTITHTLGRMHFLIGVSPKDALEGTHNENDGFYRCIARSWHFPHCPQTSVEKHPRGCVIVCVTMHVRSINSSSPCILSVD